MKRSLLILLVLLNCWYALADQPVVFVLDGKKLQENRSRIKDNDPLLIPAYKMLLRDAEAALNFGPVSVMEKKQLPPSGDKHDYMSLAPYFWPDPSRPGGLPYIRKDGQTNPEVKDYKDKEYQPRLCEEVQVLALAWFYSGEKRYAEHAAKLLKVWFLDSATRMNPNLNFGQAIKGVTTGRGAGLIDTRHYVKLIDAIGLLRSSKAWKKEYQLGMEKWFSAFLHWMQTSRIGLDELDAGNNHGAWYDAQRLSMALFTGQKDLAREVVQSAMNRLDSQMNDAGDFPRELERTISLHYTVFVMDAFFQIARMAEKIKMDFWNYTSPSGKSLRKGFEKLRPFITQEKKWEGQQIKPYTWEEGYMLLLLGETAYGCTSCSGAIRLMAGEKWDRLRIHLLY